MSTATSTPESKEQRRMREEYGYTNDRIWWERVTAWREAAIADGWEARPTYGGEPMERAASMARGGFTAMILAREMEPEKSKFRYWLGIDVWGPDGLCITPPDVYDWAAIVAAVKKCKLCGKVAEKTVRYSFAGRCCEACLPAARSKYEKPGWCD